MQSILLSSCVATVGCAANTNSKHTVTSSELPSAFAAVVAETVAMWRKQRITALREAPVFESASPALEPADNFFESEIERLGEQVNITICLGTPYEAIARDMGCDYAVAYDALSVLHGNTDTASNARRLQAWLDDIDFKPFDDECFNVNRVSGEHVALFIDGVYRIVWTNSRCDNPRWMTRDLTMKSLSEKPCAYFEMPTFVSKSVRQTIAQQCRKVEVVPVQ